MTAQRPPARPPQDYLRWRWVLLGLFIAFAAIFRRVLDHRGHSAHENAGKVIRHEVASESGTALNVTYLINHGEQQDTNVPLPWFKEFTADQGFRTFVVSAQDAGSGPISCKILVDGKVIDQQTSNGRYAVVICSGP